MNNTKTSSHPLKVGDVVQIFASGNGFMVEDVGSFVEILSAKVYETSRYGYTYDIAEYDSSLKSTRNTGGLIDVWAETFGYRPLIICNTREEALEESSRFPEEMDAQIFVGFGSSQPKEEDQYSVSHYDNYYHLTEEDFEAGKIKVDAYWVAKQWRTGSRDDSGALWHSLKTIARFGEKNSVEREIKALYNQAKALGRIYGVKLDE